MRWRTTTGAPRLRALQLFRRLTTFGDLRLFRGDRIIKQLSRAQSVRRSSQPGFFGCRRARRDGCQSTPG